MLSLVRLYALTHWRINKQGFENVVKPSWLNALHFVLFCIFFVSACAFG